MIHRASSQESTTRKNMSNARLRQNMCIWYFVLDTNTIHCIIDTLLRYATLFILMQSNLLNIKHKPLNIKFQEHGFFCIIPALSKYEVRSTFSWRQYVLYVRTRFTQVTFSNYTHDAQPIRVLQNVWPYMTSLTQKCSMPKQWPKKVSLRYERTNVNLTTIIDGISLGYTTTAKAIAYF